MKTLGCIAGKIHIMQAVQVDQTVTVGLRVGETTILFSDVEALDLADVISYAATDNLELLAEIRTDNFKSAEKGECTCG